MKKILLLSALLIFACGLGQTTEDYLNSGIDKLEANDYYGAINDFNKVIELKPNDVDAFNNRGVAKKKLKDYNGAISDFFYI